MIDRELSVLLLSDGGPATESGFYRFRVAQVYLPRPVVQMTERTPANQVRLAEWNLRRNRAPLALRSNYGTCAAQYLSWWKR